MARFVAGVALGLALGLIVTARADDTDEVMAAAAEANVDPADLSAALASLDAAGINATPRGYLESVGELATAEPPAPVRASPQASAVMAGGGSAATLGWPIGGALGARIYCIESVESHHGAAMGPNPVGVWNAKRGVYEHAVGWLGWLPSTAAQWGVQIGSRASEWRGAARILAQGERFARTQFYGVGAGIC